MDGLRLLETLHRSEQSANDIFNELFGDLDVTSRQATVLMRIGEVDGPSQTALTEATGIDRSTLADICQRLKRKGWITRKRTPQDTRTYALKLTPAGATVLGKVEAKAAALATRLRRQLPGIEGLKIAPVREAAE
jgi:DNA-binding MarR family transcriptional regulator